mgnify:CR=1 FL=1
MAQTSNITPFDEMDTKLAAGKSLLSTPALDQKLKNKKYLDNIKKLKKKGKL